MSILSSVKEHLVEPTFNRFDWGSLGLAVATFFNWLPQISALLAAVWFCLRIAIGLQEWKLNQRKLKK